MLGYTAAAQRKYDVSHVGGEIFAATDEPSEHYILWGEVLKEKERTFLRKEMQSMTVSFSIKDTFQIDVRCLWQPEAKGSTGPGGHGYRKGRFVTLLHGHQEPLSSAWVWIKLARPLFRAGFSVIMVDLPGFGRSKINLDPSGSARGTYKQQDWHIVSQLLDSLRVHSSHMVALGQSCGTVLRLLLRSPHLLEREHVFFDACMDFDQVFEHLGPPPPGSNNWKELQRDKQIKCLEEIFKKTKARVWSFHDREHLNPEIRRMQWLLADATTNPVMMRRIQVQDVSKSDLCKCHFGVGIPVSFLMVSKRLSSTIVEFLATREQGHGFSSCMPQYVSCDPALAAEKPWSAICGKDTSDTISSADQSDQSQSLTAILMESGRKAIGFDKEQVVVQLPDPGTLSRARWRMAEVPETMETSQEKGRVRRIEGRKDTGMWKGAEEAIRMQGDSDEAMRQKISLLSKLSRRVKAKVWAEQETQSLDGDEEIDEDAEQPTFEGFGAEKMAEVLAKKRTREKRRSKSSSKESGRPSSPLPSSSLEASSRSRSRSASFLGRVAGAIRGSKDSTGSRSQAVLTDTGSGKSPEPALPALGVAAPLAFRRTSLRSSISVEKGRNRGESGDLATLGSPKLEAEKTPQQTVEGTTEESITASRRKSSLSTKEKKEEGDVRRPSLTFEIPVPVKPSHRSRSLTLEVMVPREASKHSDGSPPPPRTPTSPTLLGRVGGLRQTF
eukprot:TRINITY_DN91792_c0_g1_i1.p1 TRINITY_DN91792_c0_g1~~TRINITY_DN91792_c0_g1_i1.p1  ORF type:complete len:725 (+),score=142.18 TRINITY_DN91792_c0_g1_i1:71-2245(+)